MSAAKVCIAPNISVRIKVSSFICYQREEFSCSTHGRCQESNPIGIPAQSPRWRGTSYLGKPLPNWRQPQRGCVVVAMCMTQPRWGWGARFDQTQGSSCLATLGWTTQSLWDWPQQVSRSTDGAVGALQIATFPDRDWIRRTSRSELAP